MKGTFFHESLEYALDIQGESWSQGNRVVGTLSIKSPQDFDFNSYGVFLAYVDYKKFKAKDVKAFSILQKSLCDSERTRFEFFLPKDCPITEKAGSLYVLCGPKENLYLGGHLELNVSSHKVIQDFVQILEFHHRFKIKGLKNKKNFIEATIQLPDSRKYISVQSFKLLMKIENENLKLRFQLKLKKVDLSSGPVTTKDEKVEIDRELNKDQYHIYGEAINQEAISKVIEEILDKVKVNSLI